ncbi:MAG: hypothetical protein JOZ62_11300 [Acidobacteriaceae bacterium]|nr:hypothetical protein [Acidobacteriaceae bacterium]
MRILLDECVDESLRHCFSPHVCQTCRYAGFNGLTNGELIDAAEQAGFDVLITVDQNMPYQQRIQNRTVSVIVLRGRTTSIDDLVILMPDVLATLEVLKPGTVMCIEMRSRCRD